jgi:hypothetical protein
MDENDEAVSAQFGCITFHSSRCGGQTKLTPTMKNKWSNGWASDWFYCRVPLHKSGAGGKGIPLLHSEMSSSNHLMEPPHNCVAYDLSATTFELATKTIGGHDAVEEYLVCNILPLNDTWDLAVQTDWSGEYERLNSFFCTIGISHHVSCPHAHQQNGAAERKHRHIVEMRLALIANASMPLKF